tara:strand:+ start:200 stop:562 length:363 start_codon:yes stop_codon:yes gene_type:complete
MATSTSPTAGDGTLSPNQLSVNDYYQAGVPVPSGTSGNGNSNLGPRRICEFDALKAIQGKGCSGGGNRVLQSAVYSLVIFFIAKRMFPKQAMGVMVGSLVLGVFSALAVTKLVDVSNRKK